MLDKPEDPVTDTPLNGVGWTEVKDNTDVMIFVVTVENVDFDLCWDLEQGIVFEDGFDKEISLDAGIVVRGCGGVKSHG